MEATRPKVLLITTWLSCLVAAEAFVQARIPVDVTCVDVEPALAAAMEREHFELAIYVRRTPGVSEATAIRMIHDHEPDLEVVVANRVEDAFDRVRAIVRARVN
jgi:DNA-binding NarL/FixJ family response regulator